MNFENLVERWSELYYNTLDMMDYFDNFNSMEQAKEEVKETLLDDPKSLIDYFMDDNGFILDPYPEYKKEFLDLAKDTLEYAILNNLYN